MSLMSGYLTKSPPKRIEDFFQLKRWKRRYCELKFIDGELILEYRQYKSSKTVKGSIDFSHVKYVACNFPFLGNRRNMFALKVDSVDSSDHSRIFYFNAAFVNEFEDWMRICIAKLNFVKAKMTMDVAQELILSGFFVKSSLKGAQEYSHMFLNSLCLYLPKPNVLLELKTHECKRIIERSPNDLCDRQTESEWRNTQLPVRCTSTMTSDSDSDSDASCINDKVERDLTGTYIDSSQLNLLKSARALESKAHVDSVAYCVIDHDHTEALYRLKQRMEEEKK